jgi:hypothetical protein
VVDLTTGKDAAYQKLCEGLKRLDLDARDTLDWDPRRSPYPGLMAFLEDDAAVFFGREPEILKGLETLKSSRLS